MIMVNKRDLSFLIHNNLIEGTIFGLRDLDCAWFPVRLNHNVVTLVARLQGESKQTISIFPGFDHRICIS